MLMYKRWRDCERQEMNATGLGPDEIIRIGEVYIQQRPAIGRLVMIVMINNTKISQYFKHVRCTIFLISFSNIRL